MEKAKAIPGGDTEVVFEGLDGDPGLIEQSLKHIIKALGKEAIIYTYKRARAGPITPP